MTSSSTQLPCILACGYCEIQSPRTSLTFPAWLVLLSPSESYWRSKKDFLLLFRATKGKVQSPKTALNKLADKAPWKRPPGEDEERTTSSTASSETNNYHAPMKKNLYILDEYLQTVARLCGEDDSDIFKAWCLFVRPQDTEGLLPSKSSASAGEKLIPQKDSSSSSTIKSSKLGQYFCSDATAKQIVKLTLDYVRNNTKGGPVTFLEPSCGHGDILWQLLEDLETSYHHVIGCDLDSNVIETCQQHAKKDQVEWMQGDFLQTKRPAGQESSTLVVLGGPPYTSGAGSGENMDRSLPNVFLTHCVKTWKASFVAFILPERYRKCPMSVPGWTVQTHELDSSTFFFQGQQKTTQPSIIQCYTRKSS